MSAYVTFDIKAVDRHGELIETFPVRYPYTVDSRLALEIARERFGDIVAGAEARRSVPAKIGRVSPVTRTVSARVKVLA